jgi:hypothetical protein
MSGLLTLDLPTIFRCAVEVAEAAACLTETEWADLPANCDGPGSPFFERQMEASRRLRRIEEEAERLKRSLGATGPLGHADDEKDGGPEWDSFEQDFNNCTHDRVVRLAQTKLATAAIDLSGFATWREWQWHMRETGLRLLAWGLAQLWEGMSGEERSRVRDRLSRTHEAVGWPADPATDPPPYDGPEEIPLPDQYRIISNFVACYGGYLDDVLKADNRRVEQRQEEFLSRATPAEFVETAERTTQTLQAKVNPEWVELRKRVFRGLECLRRAQEIPPREAWPALALQQRGLLAEAADILLKCVGSGPKDKAERKPEDAKKALEDYTKALQDFTKATSQLRNSIEGPFIERLLAEPGSIPTETAPAVTTEPAPKRSTVRGEGRAKLIAALTKHHQYADGGCLNLQPIGNNELAMSVDVAPSTASAFFKDEFQGHAKYRAVCRGAGKLVDCLKALNGEFSPHDLYGRRPAGEDDRNDEDDE